MQLLCRAVWAIPAYETITISGPPAPAGTLVHVNNMNDDGAVPIAWYDDTRSAWAVGSWQPVPLYGRPAGWAELYTVPVAGNGSSQPVWPFISPTGTVTYAGTGFPGSPEGINVNGAPASLTWPGPCENGFLCGRGSGPTAGLAIAATSAAAPFAHWQNSQSERATIFEPWTTVFNAAYAMNGGAGMIGMPGGYDYAHVAIATHTGHRVWTGFNRVGDPNQGTLELQTFNYVESPAGSFETGGAVQWITGRGDVAYTPTENGQSAGSGLTPLVRLAGPFGSFSAGTYAQSALPGMPAGHRIAAMNGAGTVLAVRNTPLLRYRVVAGGKSAALSALTNVPEPSNGSYGTPELNENGMLMLRPVNVVGGQLQHLGNHLLIPTLDCEVALAGTQPYRIGEEFDLDVTVRNVAGNTVTNVRVEGQTPGSPGISVGTFPSFDIIGGPTPVTPLDLTAGATQVISYRCRATRSGIGEVKAQVKATAAGGSPLRCEVTTPIEIELRADLLLKRSDEPAGDFALNDVYQKTAPSGAQDRHEQFNGDGEAISFDVKIENDEAGPLTLRLTVLETGSTAIPARWFHGATEIPDFAVTGWTTPVIPAGGSVMLRVEFGPTDGAVAGDVRTARLTLQPADGGGPADMGRMEVVNAPPVQVTLRRPEASGLYEQSILAGKGDVNAPLIFSNDSVALRTQARVSRGLVADGVTPLLFEMEVDPSDLTGLPGGVTYKVSLEPIAGGILRNIPVAQRLRVLKDGTWQQVSQLTFTESQHRHFACITPVNPDDLQLLGAAKELTLRLTFRRPDTDAFVTGKNMLLRRPPIALVHGYNTNGDWGDGTRNVLGLSRGLDFVKTIRYGQEPPDVEDRQRETTVLSFSQLVPKLEQEFAALRSEIREAGWAMTRHDVFAHSQGGVLTRMLCSQNANAWLEFPFRNLDNHYRGRFHRVVTVGSPHNGTRLVSFMERAARRYGGNFLRWGVARQISDYMISSGNSQPKFDPFGQAIRLLHHADPSAPWHPDPGAMFHLVATTINHGQSPAFGTGALSEAALGLTSLYGPAVLPRGSDGVVDFDSQTATTPEAGQQMPANAYRMPAALNISHALVIQAGLNLFGGDAGQVDSLDVAAHAIGALDQDPLLPAPDRVFGPFRLALPLPQSVADNLENAAQNVTLSEAAVGFAAGPSPRDVIFPVCQFELPPGEVLAGPVTWFAERYGENGLTTEGVSLHPVGHPGRIGVQIDRSYWGDVVLYGTARTVSGRIITGAPFVVESTMPDELTWALDGIEVEPNGGSYPVGAAIEPVLWETWLSQPDEEGNGGGESLRVRRFPRADNILLSVIPAQALNVDDPLLWRAAAPGLVDVYVSVPNQSATAFVQFTVYPATTNGEDHDGDGRSTTDESGVPNRTGPGTGDGNGDGIADASQLHVASVRGPSGQWFTLASAGGAHPLTEVTPQPPPADPALLPEASAFDFGFIQFTVHGLTFGGSTVVTVHLPENHEVTGLWACGAEPGIEEPHWFEFLHNGQTGGIIESNRILLHLTDGGPGDADGLADGIITVLPLGPSRFIPPPPALEFLTGPQLTWPVVFSNSSRTLLESSGDLRTWQFVPELPQTSGAQNLLPVPGGASHGFFRLRGF
jgi:hypothetical protein